MIELVALPPFVYATVQDYKMRKVKNGIALAFEVLAFIAATWRWGIAAALVLWALGKTVAVVMAKFGVIRLVDMLLFTGYVLLVGNLYWIALSIGIVSALVVYGVRKEKRVWPLTPVLFALFIIYYIGYLGVA